MSYLLLDYVNCRNADELSREDRDGRPHMSADWAPTSEEIRTRHGRRLGRGDRVHCGEPIVPDSRIPTAAISRRGFNVCRPFDEAHAAREARNWSAEPFTKYGALRAYNGTNNVGVEWARPQNHGHGAKCTCRRTMRYDQYQKATGERVAIGRMGRRKPGTPVLTAALDCRWCDGTGNVICDQTGALVSLSHWKGGYSAYYSAHRQRQRVEGLEHLAEYMRP